MKKQTIHKALEVVKELNDESLEIGLDYYLLPFKFRTIGYDNYPVIIFCDVVVFDSNLCENISKKEIREIVVKESKKIIKNLNKLIKNI